MKRTFAWVLLAVLGSSLTAVAGTQVRTPASNEQGIPSDQAEALVFDHAKKFSLQNAEDCAGGLVRKPCSAEIAGDGYAVICSGRWALEVGGGGCKLTEFKCTGSFVQGHDGMIYPADAHKSIEQSISCR